MSETNTWVVTGPLPPYEGDDSRAQSGAELIFHGRVRGEEHGKPIRALDYEYYDGMAQKQLAQLASQTEERFDIQALQCWHRVGEVPVGEASLRVVIWSKHRAAGLKAMSWFIIELKRAVPIWKWAVTQDGERYPSHCDHDHDHDHDH